MPEGAYALAGKLLEVISETRQQIMELTEIENGAEVVFTASATLACNEIFGGIDWKKKRTVYVSPFEHNATMRSLFFISEAVWISRSQNLLSMKKGMELDQEKIRFQFMREKPISGSDVSCEQCYRLYSSGGRRNRSSVSQRIRSD